MRSARGPSPRRRPAATQRPRGRAPQPGAAERERGRRAGAGQRTRGKFRSRPTTSRGLKQGRPGAVPAEPSPTARLGPAPPAAARPWRDGRRQQPGSGCVSRGGGLPRGPRRRRRWSGPPVPPARPPAEGRRRRPGAAGRMAGSVPPPPPPPPAGAERAGNAVAQKCPPGAGEVAERRGAGGALAPAGGRGGDGTGTRTSWLKQPPPLRPGPARLPPCPVPRPTASPRGGGSRGRPRGPGYLLPGDTLETPPTSANTKEN